MGSTKVVLASALALTAVLSLLAMPAEALSRSAGDYWVYEGGMDIEGVQASGSFRYEFEKSDSLTIGSTVYEVNVMRITGSMTGITDDLLGMSASVEATFDGRTYETKDGFGTVKDDMYMWANMTIGTGSFSLVMRTESQEVTTYSPPAFSGFDADGTGTGDEWDETVNVTSSSTVWVDGAIDDTSSDTYEETLSYSVAASEDTVTTDAGTFDCLKITVTDSEGDYEVNWYSGEVGNFVKMSYFELGESTPFLSLELTEYRFSGDDGMLLTLVIGVGVVVVAVVIAAALLLMRRRGRAPEQPLPPPPSQ